MRKAPFLFSVFMFRFKHFVIHDDLCAMKVGTDGVLIGAWANLSLEEGSITTTPHCLDVGTGSGIIALMLAQRFPKWKIDSIDIDEQAVIQAQRNFSSSPFEERLSVRNADFLNSSFPQKTYDAIVSNPPFFQETLCSPDGRRALARHTSVGFDFPRFIEKSSALLRSGGSLQVILPYDAQNSFHEECNRNGLSLIRQTIVKTVDRKPPKRVLLHFKKERISVTVERNQLILTKDGMRTDEYAQLCQDFYL